MGDLYLVDMADWLRAAGLDVYEQGGWQYRSRSSGGYDGWPLCIMEHHTAGPGGEGEADADYCSYTDSDRPITNLVIGNTGHVWVCAGGATNCNGKGYARSFSRGTVPDDDMNRYAVAIELSNNGIGEPYPQVQIDAMFTATLVLNERFGNRPDDVCTHQQWAPDRKIDPATAAAVQGPWQPGSCTSAGSWDLDDLKAECRRRASSPAPLPPTPPEDEVTDDDIERIAKRAAELVWHHKIDATAADDPKQASQLLELCFRMLRQYEGGYSGKEPPSPTMLQDIHNKVSTILKRQ